MRQILFLAIILAAASIFSTAQDQSSTNDSRTGAGVRRSLQTSKSTEQQNERKFVGTIVKKRHAYVLQAADRQYLLNDHQKAKKYAGKRVRVTGDSNDNSVIRVEAIQLWPQ